MIEFFGLAGSELKRPSNSTVKGNLLRNLLPAFAYALIAIFYFWINQAVRPVWLDEALTYYQVVGRRFPELIRSFDEGVNLLPYAYFIAPWAVGSFVELDPFALRLPSLIFGLIALLIVHRILSQEFGGLIAFTSVFFTFFVTSEFQGYLAEARPYSLYTLAAGIHLGTALLLSQQESRKAWWANVVTAFIFPSVHYVGLIYSFALAATLVVVGGSTKKSIAKIFSFFIGWILFFIVHSKLLWVVFSGQSLSDPDAFARPSLTKAAMEANQFFDLPAEISVCMIAVMAISVIFRLRCSVGMQDLKEFKLEFPSNFLIGVCVAWLLVPVGLKLIAAFGFFNLTVPRYLLPTLIANAIGVGLFISVCCQIAEQQIDASDTKQGFLRHKRFAIPAVIALLVFFAIVENVGIQRRVVAAGRVDGKKAFSEKLLLQDQGSIPFFTTDAHNFIAYAYHTRDDIDRNVSLIVDDATIDRWRHFAPQIGYVALNDLPSMKGGYHLCVNESTSGHNSPFSDLETRIASAGHGVEEVRTSDELTLYYIGNDDQ